MTKDQMRSIEEALDLALEALIYASSYCDTYDAIAAIKQVRSAPVRGYDWMWCEAPIKTMWGHEMVVSYLAIDKDNTVSVYCERDQTAKVEAMFNPPAQPAPVQSAERGEPVATKLETQQFNCFHVSAEDFQRLKALPVGAKLYTTPPNVATPLAAQQDIERLSALVRAQQITIDKLEAAQPAPVQEPVAHPFEDKSVISALAWAAGLIQKEYHAGHNGADSWLMNYADKQGERIRLADHREWEKVHGRWQPIDTPPAAQRQWVGLTDEQKCELVEMTDSDPQPHHLRELIDVTEAKLKEKNT